MSCMTYIDYLKMTITVDDAIMTDPQNLMKRIEESLRECMSMTTLKQD